MKQNIFKFNVAGTLLLAALLLLINACSPDLENGEFGRLSEADFEILPGADANSYTVVNKTNGASIPHWVLSTGQKYTGDTAHLHFIFEGTYNVTLLAVSQGGLDSITKQISIAQSDPTACDPSHAIGFIASCTQKTWKLNPAEGAYKVGEGPDVGNWWTSGAGEVGGRPCEFNDEYTFSFNAEGTFVYDNKGDFFGDGYMGTGSGCQPNTNLSAAQAPWASGTFKFSVIEDAGVKGLGQLKVIGIGAHIGLQKVRNGGETTSAPTWESITYDILEMKHDPAGYDLLKIGTNIGGAGWWTFALRSY